MSRAALLALAALLAADRAVAAEIAVSPPTARPGDAVLVSVSGADAEPTGAIAGRPLRFWRAGKAWRALAALPIEIFEAARIDRASAWQRFWHITLPLIRPAIVIVIIMRMMIALSAFAAIFAATGGGPGTATEILNLYVYRTSFDALNFGYGAALGVVLLVITLGVSFFLFRMRRSR